VKDFGQESEASVSIICCYNTISEDVTNCKKNGI